MTNEASKLDEQFPCPWRSAFEYPTFKSMGLDDTNENEVTYLCGNSLGLMPKATKNAVNLELQAWANQGVMGHHTRHDKRDPWVTNDDSVAERLAKLVFGCKSSEISYTSTLTSNLNALVQAFYRPTQTRYKLICEAKAFPSDIYCFQNQVKLHNFDPADALILLEPKQGEDIISNDTIIDVIKEHGESIALVCLPGIQFYSGQYFDIPRITAATKSVGAISGWDLAHASGNVPLHLHDWGVDFAVFCSYKYLNCGPGNLGGLFVHDDTSKKYANEPRPAGWWGVTVDTRFNMNPQFEAAPGARGFAQSNISLFGPPCMHSSLDLFEQAGGVGALHARSRSLTGFLEKRLKESVHYGSDRVFRIMTEKLPTEERGCQISIAFNEKYSIMDKVNSGLIEAGVIGDERKPSVIRLAPVPLYNTHAEVDYAVSIFDDIVSRIVCPQ